MMTGRILVVGGSGYVGQHLLARLGSRVAAATYASVPFPGGVPFDLRSMRLDDLSFDRQNVSHAIILAADSKPDRCLADPERSRAINVTGALALSEDLLAAGIRPVFASTEFVFDGNRGAYSEEDEARPILLYGQQKLETEQRLLALDSRALVFRLAKVYGDRPGDGTLFTSWLDALRDGVRLRCAADQAFSPVHVGDVAEALVRGVDHGLVGVYHLSGGQRFTRLELLEMTIRAVRRRCRLDVIVEPCSIHDFGLPERRPEDVSMRNDRLAAAIGLRFRAVEDACENIVANQISR